MDHVNQASLIDQWDADALTALINDVIISKLKGITEIFPVSYNIWDRFKVDAIIQFLITFSCLKRHSCLPGQKLLNISMSSQKTRVLTFSDCLKYALSEIVIKYSQNASVDRIDMSKLLQSYKTKGVFTKDVYLAIRWLAAIAVRSSVLLNDMAFIASGRYKKLPDRIFKFSSTSTASNAGGPTADSVPREVIWKLSFGVIYVTITTLMRLQWFYRIYRKVESGIRNDRVEKEMGIDTCPVCGLQPTMPCRVKPCAHVYCYFCIHQKLKVETNNSFCSRRKCYVKIDTYNSM